MSADRPVDRVLSALHERAKELNCLYEVEEILNRSELPLEKVFMGVVKALVPGMQHEDVCEAEIVYEHMHFATQGFDDAMPWVLSVPLRVQTQKVGSLKVIYTQYHPDADSGPFLKEEERLIRTVGERLNHFLLFRKLRDVRQAEDRIARNGASSWQGPVHLLRRSDRHLYAHIARKMINHLCWMGVKDAQKLLGAVSECGSFVGEVNQPAHCRLIDRQILEGDLPFEMAELFMTSEEILDRVQRWIQEDRAGVFLRVLEDAHAPLGEIADALRRFHHVIADGAVLSDATMKGLRVSMVRRFLSEQLEYIKVAKEHVSTADFEQLLGRLILPMESHGRLGGKGAGLFLAHRILNSLTDGDSDVGPIRIPKTWYLASDGLLDFMRHNDLEDLMEQKYKSIDQVRSEYPNVVQLFKNSSFPDELRKGLSLALDDLGEVPIIVRSSSLLEDRLGTAFSGKYKSLFLPNLGSKTERMDALLDAIAEIYASTFGPDPIAYRRERDLLDFYEEMGILIQQVVGRRVGPYFLPAFAGVAFSNNEFRWSSRIRREDGLIRMVPGLGTRAVDRTGDDYPSLVVPGQPSLRVNANIDEVIRYAPKRVDLLNMETGRFETVDMKTLLNTCGTDLPGFEQVLSQVHHDLLKKPVSLLVDPRQDELVVTFEGLYRDTDFIARMRKILEILGDRLQTPVDIEFAHDGEHFYLLQCRPQAHAVDSAPAPIPQDVSADKVIFSAHRYISNGWVPDITHIVYVDPAGYGELGSEAELKEVGRAVGKLNKLLPKRRFILMGPGRWGSRGDVRLGVSVTYSDISNSSVLIEIAREKGNYLPDLSFGTHFFQDLVESAIRYIPLYPDQAPSRFNERFLMRSPNILPEMLPEFAHLKNVLRVIDVPAVSEGRVLKVLLNADLDEALAILSLPDEADGPPQPQPQPEPAGSSEYWRWRYEMAERIAAELDPIRFGVKAFYVIGSAKNATSGPASDIDLLIHVEDDQPKQVALRDWLEGWSLCLEEMNYLKTGYRTGAGMLDVHLITDEDIERKTSFAVKISAVTDAARALPVGTGSQSPNAASAGGIPNRSPSKE